MSKNSFLSVSGLILLLRVLMGAGVITAGGGGDLYFNRNLVEAGRVVGGLGDAGPPGSCSTAGNGSCLSAVPSNTHNVGLDSRRCLRIEESSS